MSLYEDEERETLSLEEKRERGAVLQCGGCRVSLSWNPLKEVYYCPDCGWEKQ